MKSKRMRWVMLFLSFFLFHSFAFSQVSEKAEEYNMKATFIYNFTKFIEWESAPPGNEFIIGVVGSSPITVPLSEIARTKMVGDKKIILRQFSSADEIGYCHILFISHDSRVPLETILSKGAEKGTPTISEKEGFAAKGTAINFVVINDKLKFESNVKVINEGGLKASSQLLKLAIIVE